MKILFSQHINYQPNTHVSLQKSSYQALTACVNEKMELPKCYYVSQVNFGHKNTTELKKLFKLGLPCIYTGKEMIDSRVVKEILKLDFSRLSASSVCRKIFPYYERMNAIEKKVFMLINEQAVLNDNANIMNVIESLKMSLEGTLVKEQMSIIKTISAYSYSLDDNLRMELNGLLQKTEDRIHNIPTYCEFSPKEFMYKLNKIKNDDYIKQDKKMYLAVCDLEEIYKKMDLDDNIKSIYRNKKIINKMEAFIHNTVLNNYTPIINLINISKAQLNGNKVLVPFSRKGFIFDLSNIINKSEDSEIKKIIMKIANKLPTSKGSPEAFIAKYSKEAPEKFVYRLLWPSIATIEHLKPKSLGGIDAMSNYAGACAQANSDRMSVPFVEWVEKHPETAKYCQKYVDRLIEYANNGIFELENINIKYIDEFKKTIEELSEGVIILDTSRLKIKQAQI
ncbi:hypothetical protein J6R97_04270 [bacterium]|nr:hypothetical protein [bacterium]